MEMAFEIWDTLNVNNSWHCPFKRENLRERKKYFTQIREWFLGGAWLTLHLGEQVGEVDEKTTKPLAPKRMNIYGTYLEGRVADPVYFRPDPDPTTAYTHQESIQTSIRFL